MNPSLDLLRKAELRHATAVELVASLESKMAQADAEWAAAVSADDGDAESAAGKRRTALKPLLADATAKLPLVAESVALARVDAVPGHAAETNAVLAGMNEKARDMARELFAHYEAARALDAQIRAIFQEHGAVGRKHRALCDVPGAPPSMLSEWRFAVDLGHLAQWFKQEFLAKFRLDIDKLLPTNGGISHGRLD